MKPIKLPSRKYSIEERKFIALEVVSLLKDGIIMKSKSPWRAQLVIVKGKKQGFFLDFETRENRPSSILKTGILLGKIPIYKTHFWSIFDIFWHFGEFFAFLDTF